MYDNYHEINTTDLNSTPHPKKKKKKKKKAATQKFLLASIYICITSQVHSVKLTPVNLIPATKLTQPDEPS